jgi:hypothetical protein
MPWALASLIRAHHPAALPNIEEAGVINLNTTATANAVETLNGWSPAVVS